MACCLFAAWFCSVHMRMVAAKKYNQQQLSLVTHRCGPAPCQKCRQVQTQPGGTAAPRSSLLARRTPARCHRFFLAAEPALPARFVYLRLVVRWAAGHMEDFGARSVDVPFDEAGAARCLCISECVCRSWGPCRRCCRLFGCEVGRWRRPRSRASSGEGVGCDRLACAAAEVPWEPAAGEAGKC